MVDFPEGYGFEPGGRAKLMQESFLVDIGVFMPNPWQASRNKTSFRRRSPFSFDPIGHVMKEDNGTPLRGILYNDRAAIPIAGPPIEGTLQQVVTALCTLHRMKGHMK